jgi:S-formylglutathione hydrolase FrmB
MGGHGAVKLAFKHPDCFCSVVGSAGPYVLADQLARPDGREELRLIFGDSTAEGGNDVFRLAEQMDRSLLPAIRLECGAEDYLLEDSRKLHAHLESLGIPHDYAELPGKHSLSGWDPHVPAGVAFHKRALGV